MADLVQNTKMYLLNSYIQIGLTWYIVNSANNFNFISHKKIQSLYLARREHTEKEHVSDYVVVIVIFPFLTLFPQEDTLASNIKSVWHLQTIQKMA